MEQSMNMSEYKIRLRKQALRSQAAMREKNAKKIPVDFKIKGKMTRVLLTSEQFQKANHEAKKRNINLSEHYKKKYERPESSSKAFVLETNIRQDIIKYLADRNLPISFFSTKHKVRTPDHVLMKKTIRDMKAKFKNITVISKVLRISYDKVYKS